MDKYVVSLVENTYAGRKIDGKPAWGNMYLHERKHRESANVFMDLLLDENPSAEIIRIGIWDDLYKHNIGGYVYYTYAYERYRYFLKTYSAGVYTGFYVHKDLDVDVCLAKHSFSSYPQGKSIVKQIEDLKGNEIYYYDYSTLRAENGGKLEIYRNPRGLDFDRDVIVRSNTLALGAIIKDASED